MRPFPTRSGVSSRIGGICLPPARGEFANRSHTSAWPHANKLWFLTEPSFYNDNSAPDTFDSNPRPQHAIARS